MTTFTWRESYPMAPYLATITLGRFDVTTGMTPSGIPTYIAVDPRQASSASAVLRKLPAMVSFLENLYGSYPFEAVGAIVDDAPSSATHSRPRPSRSSTTHPTRSPCSTSSRTCGSATRSRCGSWPDIWLHEGFATWSEWIWTEQQGGKSAAQQFKQLANTPAQQTSFWNPPPGNPGDAQHLFDGTIYERGAMTLQALRERIGDAQFTDLLRTWYAEHRYGTVTTAEFIALAERVSGQDLRPFFDAWLYQPGKPSLLGASGASRSMTGTLSSTGFMR